MDKKNLMNGFIIIIMLGSIFGFAILASQGRGEQPPPEPPPIENPTIINFRADGIDAGVVQIFSSMFVTGATNEIDIDKIDSDIYAIEGVRRINSFYRQITDSTIEGALIYVAEVSFEEGYTARKLIEEIKELDYLYGVEVYSLGLVSLPPTVTLTNADLNLTKEHTFNNPLSQCYLSINTIEGDSLLVSLELAISGKREVSIVAFESQNLTAAPKLVSLTEELEIESLQSKLFFEAITDYSNAISIDLNELGREIEELEQVESISMDKIGPPSPGILIELDGNYVNLEQDVNNLLTDLNGVADFVLYLDQNFLSFNFDLESDFLLLRSGVLHGLQDLGIGVQKFNEPKVSLQGDLNIVTENAVDPAASLSNLLEEKNFGVSVQQYASFEAESFMDPDTNSTYFIDTNSFEAKIPSTHKAGDLVELEILFYGIRDRATWIQAMEILSEGEVG